MALLDPYLIVWIFAAIAIGLLIGRFLIADPSAFFAPLTVGTTNLPLAISLIVMRYLPAHQSPLRQATTSFFNPRLLGPSMLRNWIIGPVVM